MDDSKVVRPEVGFATGVVPWAAFFVERVPRFPVGFEYERAVWDVRVDGITAEPFLSDDMIASMVQYHEHDFFGLRLRVIEGAIGVHTGGYLGALFAVLWRLKTRKPACSTVWTNVRCSAELTLGDVGVVLGGVAAAEMCCADLSFGRCGQCLCPMLSARTIGAAWQTTGVHTDIITHIVKKVCERAGYGK